MSETTTPTPTYGVHENGDRVLEKDSTYAVGGRVCIAVDDRRLTPIAGDNTHAAGVYPADQIEPLEAVGSEEWVNRMVRIREILIRDLTNERNELRNLRDHLEGLGQALLEQAEDRDWCSEYDEFADEWNLPKRTRSYEVTVTLTVTARDEESAEEWVRESMGISQYSVEDGPHYSVQEM